MKQILKVNLDRKSDHKNYIPFVSLINAFFLNYLFARTFYLFIMKSRSKARFQIIFSEIQEFK